MIDSIRLRAFLSDRQGLLSRQSGLTPQSLLEKYGWIRSIAGCNSYLAGFARAGIRRGQFDSEVESLDISELPAARGCTYIVPKRDFSLAIRLSQSSLGNEFKNAKKLGMPEEELVVLKAGILGSLTKDPQDPNSLKQELGNLIRSFGEEGKSKGLSTSLPVALGELQREGKIIRRPVSGRLDEQRYRYAIWSDATIRPESFSREESLATFGKLFYEWAAIASFEQFAVVAGSSGKAAKGAVAHLGLAPLSDGSELLATEETREALGRFEPPSEPIYRLVNRLDSLLLLKDELSFFLDALAESCLTAINGPAKNGIRNELNFNPILDRGLIIGLWEFDFDAGEIVYWVFGPTSDGLREEIRHTRDFIVEELGDARTASLDSPKSRGPRIERLRNFAQQKTL